MIKLLLGALVVVSFSIVGIKMKDAKIFVREFFEKLKIFNDELAVDISLYSRSVEDCLKNFSEKTDGVLNGYENIVKGEKFIFKDKRFNKKQRDFIEFYVNSLGRSNAEYESGRLKKLGEKINLILAEVTSKANAYSALSVKLSVCLGLVIFIMIF